MQKRYASIYFPCLLTDQLLSRRPELTGKPLVISTPGKGKIILVAACPLARRGGAREGMALADARAIVPELEVSEYKPGRTEKLLQAIGEWMIRYSPLVAVDAPSGLILDVSGCCHLWGGEQGYLAEIVARLQGKGYRARAAIAETIGAAWAMARYSQGQTSLVPPASQAQSLLPLPPAALRLEADTLKRLEKLGFSQIGSFVSMSSSVLRRRFGEGLLLRLAQALGHEEETLVPIRTLPPYFERLPCLEPVRTAKAIEIAIEKLLEMLCARLQSEGKGLRTAVLRAYRVDGLVEQVQIGTTQASHDAPHLFKLLQLKVARITPALGVELFTLEALGVEEVDRVQEALWKNQPGLAGTDLARLLDRLAGKAGLPAISRFLPAAHYWPERSITIASSLTAKAELAWQQGKPRPVLLLAEPERVEVAAPIPDYPPMLFTYHGKVHYIKKADGPERIEREWWLEEGQHRDYYVVEDHDGQRYWIFRLGHYQRNQSHQWFLHGFFA